MRYTGARNHCEISLIIFWIEY